MPAPLALLALATIAAPNPTAPIEGRWVGPGQNLIIAIAPCGELQWCGTVEWASEKAQADAQKSTPKLIGTQLLTGVKAKGALRWQGRLFIPDKNVRASAKLEITADDRLKVSGCSVGGLICKSQFWQRSATPLPSQPSS